MVWPSPLPVLILSLSTSQLTFWEPCVLAVWLAVLHKYVLSDVSLPLPKMPYSKPTTLSHLLINSYSSFRTLHKFHLLQKPLMTFLTYHWFLSYLSTHQSTYHVLIKTSFISLNLCYLPQDQIFSILEAPVHDIHALRGESLIQPGAQPGLYLLAVQEPLRDVWLMA